MFKWPGAYLWHDGHTDQHYLGHASGGVLISSKLHKHDAPGAVKHPHTDGAIPGQQPKNDQAAGAGVKTYAQYALPFGHIDHEAKQRGGTNLFHYDYNGKNEAVNKLVADHGFQTYYAGGKYGKPDLSKRNYNTKHLMVYDPTPGSGGDFGDQTYTDSWRKTHELSHALAYPELNKMYGEGRRIGKLGTHRTLNEALRAVHWEHLAAHKQRELNAQLGIHVPDETFNREYATVMHDAVHRAVTGKFTEPSEEGFVPHSHPIPLETSLGMVREAARNMGLQGPHDILKKSQSYSSGAHLVPNDDKMNIPQTLHELHKGMVKIWEQSCLDLRKAELAKDDMPDDAAGGGDMAMGEDDARCESYAKGELKLTKGQILPGEMSKPADPGGGAGPSAPPAPAPTELPDPPSVGKAECKGSALCKCSKCEGVDSYAKGELAPAGASPDGVSASGNKGKAPPTKTTALLPKSQAGGNDGTDIKKAGLSTSSPAAAGSTPKPPVMGGAPKLPGAGASAMPKPPKLPGMGAAGAVAKPAAPKTPPMGAGTPTLKAELTKTGLSPRDQQQQAVKLPGVRQSVGGLMDKMAAPKPPAVGLSAGTTLPATAPAPQLAGVGQPIAKPAAVPQTMVERVAARMPASGAALPGAALTPPPAAARPGVSLPGAHLFAKPGAKPALK